MKNIEKILSDIQKEYNKLNLMDYGFFDAHHDNMRIQLDCAREHADEIPFLKTKEDKEGYIADLRDTLLFMQEVIKLQEMTRALPKCIFG
jgi:hypothetical protein